MCGDMILVCKILCGDNQSLHDLFMITNPGQEARTLNFTNHLFKLQYIRKHFFGYFLVYFFRVINNWNSLPYKVVNAVCLNSFKSKLHNAWEDKI